MTSNDITQSPIQVQTNVFRISPLVSVTLVGLFLVLLAPFPLLIFQQQQQHLLPLMVLVTTIGWFLLAGLLSQRVVVDAQGVRVGYAAWVPQWLAQGWNLAWEEIEGLKSRPTSQGGQAHYFVTYTGKAYLLPMRISGFAQFLRVVETYIPFDTSQIKPLAQPWMYLLLGLCVILMGLLDVPLMVTAWKNLPALPY